MKMTGEHHIESHRLFEFAQMSRSIDQTDWEHIWNCVECGTAFLMLKAVIELRHLTGSCQADDRFI